MTCSLCNDTGWLKAGMVVTPAIGTEDDYVDWVARLVSCSHPPASGTAPEGTDTTPATAVVGARRPEDRDGLACCLPVPVASLAEQRAAHDERVAADAAAYEQRHGGAQ